MFSVIIPLYNKASYICYALETIFAQTYQKFEVIVVDDGSTDNSLENLRSAIYDLSLSEDKLSVIEQKNQGVSVARNNGVKLAKYDYIAFLDADDWWDPTYLEEMKGLIECYPNAGLYSSSYYKVLNGRTIPARMGVEETFDEGVIDYFRVYAKTMYQPVWTGAAVIKKSIFDEFCGFNPRLKMGEDFDLWHRVALKYPVVLKNKPLAYYNQDVDFVNRAIGNKLYAPHEHMLFSNYSHLKDNQRFQTLFEVLAVYGLLPYYLYKKNKGEVKCILKTIHWERHAFKYQLYYRLLPRIVVKYYFEFRKLAYRIKKLLTH